MSETTMNALSALAGVTQPAGNADGDSTDWKAKYEEAQRQLASARVEQGRVKKLDEEKKALEAKLAELDASRRAQAVMDGLPDDLRDVLPEDYAKGATLLAQRTVDAALAERDAELAQLKARNAESAQRQFAERIEQSFPGFLATAVAEGGDKHDAWVQYQRFNAASINEATKACDFDTLSWHIQQFYTNTLGIAAPSGGTGAAAPDPSTTGGGTPVAVRHGAKLTLQDVQALYDKADTALREGKEAEHDRIVKEIESAYAEGRVQ